VKQGAVIQEGVYFIPFFPEKSVDVFPHKILWSMFKNAHLAGGDGLVVSVIACYFDDSSSNPASCHLYNCVCEKTKRRPGLAHYFYKIANNLLLELRVAEKH